MPLHFHVLHLDKGLVQSTLMISGAVEMNPLCLIAHTIQYTTVTTLKMLESDVHLKVSMILQYL